jgi:Heparinase II/III-like protein/Heparinase II/III N-terminus
VGALEDEAPAGQALSGILSLGRRALRKPPHVVARRLLAEANVELERVRTPRRGRRFGNAALLEATGASSVEALWAAMLERPYPFVRTSDELEQLQLRWPDERPRVLRAAERALERRVDLLGTGPVELGSPIDWHRDWKTNRSWPLRYGRRMEYAELDRPSDVKVPWEISRVQWLLPAGQAYCLTHDERFAAGAADVIADWLRGNPYALGVNWAIAMEPALRIFSWTWLLRACGRSEAWADPSFRDRFLRSLYLHGDFVERNIERSDINGNHYTADAAGLVVAGLMLGVPRWSDAGWTILVEELPRQVHPDGVDFEASSAYHRLVGELFALPALLRQSHGLDVPAEYVERVQGMARFTQAYTGPDGLAPLWGDADDGRALPLGGQNVNDHGSFPVLTATLSGGCAPGNPEGAWLVGPDRVSAGDVEHGPKAFPNGGIFILRGGGDHVFIDCGPVGLAGRGGHGHNDCLSFEATLAGVRLVRDSGSYVYTASPELRNQFRSTAFHNTPGIDNEEQNRIDPTLLWLLTEDAKPELRLWNGERFRGTHTGYLRLSKPVSPVRTIDLDRNAHRLSILDELEGVGEHLVEIPLQLAPGVSVTQSAEGRVTLVAEGSHFVLAWSDAADWSLAIGTGWVSPSYGVRVEAARLQWSRRGPLRPLQLEIAPA